jgi:hypothetical protein
VTRSFYSKQVVLGRGFAVVASGFARGMCARLEAMSQILGPVCFEEECQVRLIL